MRVWDDLAAVESRVRAARGWFLGLDFDGTLAPIVPTPEAARMDAGMRQTVAALASRHPVTVAIISGRPLGDLASRIALPGLVYAGNHGLEIRGPFGDFVEPGAAAGREALARLTELLRRRLEAIPGALVEPKGLTTTVHFRLVEESLRPAVTRITREAAAGFAPLFRLAAGKMILEVRPDVDWHKGSAILWIRRRLDLREALPIYLGDDVTDEDAFAALPDGLTVRVGEGCRTAARYTLRDPSDVRRFLDWLLTTNDGMP